MLINKHDNYIHQIIFAMVLMFLGSSQIMAYEIGPSSLGYDPVHQALTDNAFACLEENFGKVPKECIKPIFNCIESNTENSTLNLKTCFQRNTQTGLFMGKYTSEELQEAVRWPDDPTREISLTAGIKFGAKMLGGCEDILKQLEGLDVKSGLLCNSHFGRFQFWHAQAETVYEEAATTRQRIIDWAKFNYMVATEQIPANEKYCDYFEKNPSSISDILKPSDYPFCHERKYWGWVPTSVIAPFPSYKIATLYGLTCSRVQSSTICKEKLVGQPDKRQRLTSLTAIGALLHLVQDSFSQSHIQRGPCSTQEGQQPTSRIECKPIEMYTNYAFFNKKTGTIGAQHNHDASDAWPSISKNCMSDKTGVDDPVTVSAKVMWHIQQATTGDSISATLKFNQFIEQVFNKVDVKTTSGPGVCYIRS